MEKAKVLLRPAVLEDLPCMTDIYNEALLNTNAHYFAEPRSLEERKTWFLGHGEKHPVYVALQNERVIGWASLTRWSPYHAFEDSVESSFYVHKDFRGQGLGRTLLAKVLQEGEKAGMHTVIARILEGNPSSIYIHEQLGFEHIGTMREIGKKFGKYLDLYLMQKLFNG